MFGQQVFRGKDIQLQVGFRAFEGTDISLPPHADPLRVQDLGGRGRIHVPGTR